ncbi:MAG: hypothetical protein GY854_23555 [Deltaproteobacteria bacterium]|nr:hypothetical protein [Deltaproteobacteria bacterium]
MTALNHRLYIFAFVALMVGCLGENRLIGSPGAGDGDTDTDTDTDSDTDTDADTDRDGGSDLTGTLESLRYLWLADWSSGTLSKIDTKDAREVARYLAGPDGYFMDSWSTSVNPEGDVVAVNRLCSDTFPSHTYSDSSALEGNGRSSVTKFAADKERCIDKNHNGVKDTSTGPNDVLAWEQDECMLWHTELDTEKNQICAGAIAWSHKNHVWVGTYEPARVYLLDGSDGSILNSASLPFGAWAGAIDSDGSFWIIDYPGNVDSNQVSEEGDHLMKVTSDLDITTFDLPNLLTGPCNHSIAVEPGDRIWIGGSGGICWLDPGVNKVETYIFENWILNGFKGAAVGLQNTDSNGHLWLVRKDGELARVLLKINPGSLSMYQETIAAPVPAGVGIDNEGYIWVIVNRNEFSEDDTAYKINPTTFGIVNQITLTNSHRVVGDMTGTQLWNVTQSGSQ